LIIARPSGKGIHALILPPCYKMSNKIDGPDISADFTSARWAETLTLELLPTASGDTQVGGWALGVPGWNVGGSE
jgi:hypothetical protein